MPPRAKNVPKSKKPALLEENEYARHAIMEKVCVSAVEACLTVFEIKMKPPGPALTGKLKYTITAAAENARRPFEMQPAWFAKIHEDHFPIYFEGWNSILEGKRFIRCQDSGTVIEAAIIKGWLIWRDPFAEVDDPRTGEIRMSNPNAPDGFNMIPFSFSKENHLKKLEKDLKKLEAEVLERASADEDVDDI
ncbi:hypothetical protein HK101_009309 [Irineochytrium annulatum]|nr:hypothetical protein HK101_009309 [Irineochytrium annulatum]